MVEFRETSRQVQMQQRGGGDIDMLAQANGLNANLGKLISVMQTRFALAAFTGSATLGAAVTTVVADTNVKAASVILLEATNASAATMQATAKNPYVSVKTAGTSFTIATADGTAATGGQIFSYVILNVG
jgi:hypothetical protein